jgi:signal transduction histidine kinase
MTAVRYEKLSDPGRLQALLDAVLVIESDLDLTSLLRRIITAAVELADARYGALGVLDREGKGLSQFVHVGVDAQTAETIGHVPEGLGILGLLIVEPHPIRLADLAAHPRSVGFPAGHPPMRSFLGVPIRARGQIYGYLYLTEKQGAPSFSEVDEEMVSALAVSAGIAVDNARLHTQLRELTLTEDRERIARDLHDTVIQRVFAVGLSLQGLVGRIRDPEVSERLQNAVGDLDETIRQVRTTIFALDPPPIAQGGLRAQALELCAQAARSLDFTPELRFVGPLDLVPLGVSTEVLATLREALSNVARHARASQTEVNLTATGKELHLQVTDDGVGIGQDAPGDGRGLPNMAERAEALGGSFTLSARPSGGTVISWRVPIA